MIILDELPFRFVENQGFRRFCKVFQPNFNISSLFTVAKEVSRIYFEEKDKLINALRRCRLCLTIDTWTSIQNFNYMCLTCHFIDDDWKLHKRILNFCIVDNHKGKIVGKIVESCLEEWNIEGIFTLTVENASSNDLAISYLKEVTNRWKGTILGNEFVHVRCCAHILNLIVTNGLKHHNNSIDRVNHVVRYVKASPNRLQTFKRCVQRVKIESTAILCLDAAIRWNSTYKMLKNAKKFEHAFKWMEYEDFEYILHFRDGDYDRRLPNEDD